MKIDPSYQETYDPTPAEAYLALGRAKKRLSKAIWFTFGAGISGMLLPLETISPAAHAVSQAALALIGVATVAYSFWQAQRLRDEARKIDDHFAIVGQRLESKRISP